MSRPIRIQYPGALYHITSRGNARSKIFLNNMDYQSFLTVFSEVIKRYNWIVYAYCLMPNHYHILIETPDANLSSGMRQLNGVYTQKFNFRNKRVGHVFQGRYKAILVEKEKYLGELLRYIALNPVKAKLVNNPSHWQWSSYSELTDKIEPTECLDTKKTLNLFNSSTDEARKMFIDFVKEKNHDDVWDNLKGGFLLGSFEFANSIKNYFKKQKNITEIPKKERIAHRPELKTIFEKNITTKTIRNNFIKKAYFNYGYSLTEIGRELNLHYSTISKVIKKINPTD